MCGSGLENVGCIPQCVNVQASYSCTCSAGFTIDSDQLTCIGMYACITNN